MQVASASETVYVVDDEPSVRRALGRLLRAMGLTSRGFASAEELLADEHRAEARCVLIDVHMPEMSGYELARRLAAVSPDARIILMTAMAEEVGRWRGEETSAVVLLLKPFSEAELGAALRQTLTKASGSAAAPG